MKKLLISTLLLLFLAPIHGMKRPASYMSPDDPYKTYRLPSAAAKFEYDDIQLSPAAYCPPPEEYYPTPEPAEDLSEYIQNLRDWEAQEQSQWERDQPLKKREIFSERQIARKQMHQLEAKKEAEMRRLGEAIQKGRVTTRSKRR